MMKDEFGKKISIGYRFTQCFFLILLLASCSAPQPVSMAEPTSISAPTAFPVPAHVPEIRFALIGESQNVNVWQLFDQSGATYANQAIHSGTLPSLYQLAPQDSSFQPLTAEGLPAEVVQDGDQYSAVVKLRPNLTWTDGSLFTAEDVAFTANTALVFEFEYDWGDYYPREALDRVEALDSVTVKFFFKQKPNVGDWQYGVLQAPVVQKAFWESAVREAADLLPDAALRAEISKIRANLEIAKPLLEDLTAQVTSLKVNGKQNRKLEGDYTRMQGEVVYLQATLENLLEDYAAQVKLAQASLHSVNDEKEPTLGVWLPAVKTDGVWQKQANPDLPFGAPNFDYASYYFFENENEAVAAFQNDEVDFILSPVENLPADAKYNPSSSARFLVFNPLNIYLADPSFRSALACMIDRNALAADVLQNKAAPLDSFVLSSQWHDAGLKTACADMDQSARVAYAVQLLKDAGYSWVQEPNAGDAGQKLLMSNGDAFPKVTLLAPLKEQDALRYAAAKYVAGQAQVLGIPFAVQEVELNDAVYAVYSSQKYDMALIGWRLSEYPAYLCEWFGEQNLFFAERNSDRLRAVCEAFKAESNLDAARQAVAQIESALMTELPIIPLFTVTQADVYHNLSYPAPNILNGWAGLYGAPFHAVPAQ
jgi:ABC-type transport system substrate-binding protein